MADVFLSYAREDRERAAAIAQALEARGWSVWWDRRLQYGRPFYRRIEQELDGSSCVLVLWSRASVESDWVMNEAAEGLRRQILIPAIIDRDVRIPLEFRRLHTADLTLELSQSAEFLDCLAAIAAHVRPSESASHQPAVDDSTKAMTAAISSQDVRAIESPVDRKPTSQPPKYPRALKQDDRKTKVQATVSDDGAVRGGVELVRKQATIAEPSPARGKTLSAATFAETTWQIDCRRCWPTRKYVHLRSDGAVGLRYEYTKRYDFDGTDTWRVEGNKLIISFSRGFSEETFSFVEPHSTMASGRKSNISGPLRIRRL